jgi:hypothetical protein
MMNLANAAASKTNDTTGTGFAALQIVTASCHGILNTQFIAPSPKPKWFDGLAKDLDVAKVLAKQWIDDIAPQMTASVPTHVINYGTTYTALTEQIVDLLTKNPTAKGKDNPVVKQVFALIQALEEELGTIITDVGATQTQLKTWGDQMQKVHDDLYIGAANIQSAMTDLSSDIGKMNAAIKGLKAQISADQTAVALSAAAVGIGCFLLVVGIALAFVTFGAGAIVAGVGVAAIVGGAISWGVYQAKINSEFDEIAKDQKRLTDDQRQLVALQGLSLSANTAVSATATATAALSDVKVMWAVFRGELQGTLDKLERTDEELQAIVNKAFVIAAQKEWTLAIEFAERLVGMQVPVESKTLPIGA